MNTNRLPALLILTALFFGACTTPRSTTTETPDAVATIRPLSEEEVWEVPPPDEQPVDPSREVNHVVPDSLMFSLADSGVAVERAGFRVQVFSSINRRETIEYEGRLVAWLESQSEEDLRRLGIVGQEDVYNIFSSPYYRVRIGNFVSRNQARALHDALSRTFPNVLIVPDLVRVVR